MIQSASVVLYIVIALFLLAQFFPVAALLLTVAAVVGFIAAVILAIATIASISRR